jgi:hypothetical protein
MDEDALIPGIKLLVTRSVSHPCLTSTGHALRHQITYSITFFRIHDYNLMTRSLVVVIRHSCCFGIIIFVNLRCIPTRTTRNNNTEIRIQGRSVVCEIEAYTSREEAPLLSVSLHSTTEKKRDPEMTEKSKAAAKKVEGKEAEFFDYCSLSRQEMIRLAHGTHEDRAKSHMPVSQVTTEQVLSVQPMTFLEEAACIVFLAFGVPNGVFTIPLVTFLIGKFILGSVSRAFIGLAVLWIPILLMPHPFIPSSLNSWMAVQITKYFSFRFITEERPPELSGGDGTSDKATKHPQILVGTYFHTAECASKMSSAFSSTHVFARFGNLFSRTNKPHTHQQRHPTESFRTATFWPCFFGRV